MIQHFFKSRKRYFISDHHLFLDVWQLCYSLVSHHQDQALIAIRQSVVSQKSPGARHTLNAVLSIMEPSKEQYVLLDQIWQKVRNSFTGDVLLDGGFVAVPNLSSAKHFGLFSVFVKSSKKLSISSSYQVLGHVSQVAQTDLTDMDRLFNSCLYPRSQENNLPAVKKWEKDVDLGNGKQAHLLMQGLSSNVISMNFKEGDLYLNNSIPPIERAKKVYIIDEIIKADQITVTIMDEKEDDYWEKITIPSSLPIGFRYNKFRLGGDGIVGETYKSRNPVYTRKWDVIVDSLCEYLNDLPE